MRRGVNGVIPFAMELVLLQVGFHCFSYIDERARNGGIQKQFLGGVLFSWQWVAGERVETGGIRHERRDRRHFTYGRQGARGLYAADRRRFGFCSSRS